MRDIEEDDDIERPTQFGYPEYQQRFVRKQKVSVFFGFHPSSHRPSARTFNVLREDVTSILKHGKSKHGMWFHKGQRLPSTRAQPSLPASSGLVDAETFDPIFPALELEVRVAEDRHPHPSLLHPAPSNRWLEHGLSLTPPSST